jgi:hypothetical protein
MNGLSVATCDGAEADRQDASEIRIYGFIETSLREVNAQPCPAVPRHESENLAAYPAIAVSTSRTQYDVP